MTENIVFRDGAPVYENEHYKVVIGIYPKEELESYLVMNKAFGVVEYAHSIYHFAKTWADNFSKVLSDEVAGSDTINNLPDIGRV